MSSSAGRGDIDGASDTHGPPGVAPGAGERETDVRGGRDTVRTLGRRPGAGESTPTRTEFTQLILAPHLHIAYQLVSISDIHPHLFTPKTHTFTSSHLHTLNPTLLPFCLGSSSCSARSSTPSRRKISRPASSASPPRSTSRRT